MNKISNYVFIAFPTGDNYHNHHYVIHCKFDFTVIQQHVVATELGAVLAFSIIATPNSTLLLMLLSYFSTQKSAISKVLLILLLHSNISLLLLLSTYYMYMLSLMNQPPFFWNHRLSTLVMKSFQNGMLIAHKTNGM